MNFQSIQKRMMILAIALISSTSLMAQEKRASPTKTATANISGNDVTITYGSPSVKGRDIWGALVPYGNVWRTGANETTSIEVSKDCKIGGKDLKAGKYALFTIPGEDKWTVIINKTIKWGAYSYKEAEDVLRFDATPVSNEATEQFAITVDNSGNAAIAWDKIKVPFTIK